MYNAMNPVAPRPYTAQGQGYRKENESEEKTQDSLQQGSGRGKQQNQQPQKESKTIASGRATDVINKNGQKKPMRRPNMQRRMQEANNTIQPQGNILNQPAKPANQYVQQVQQRPVKPQPIVAAQAETVQQPQQQDVAPQVKEVDAPVDARPMTAASNKINICQILKDFRNTISAIGTPEILREEVEDYLHEIEENTKGEAPSINLVQTNLLNAAAILDRYISETLNKDSKVVANWLDALFLQRINYRYNDGEVNKAFLVKFPESEEEKRAKAQKAEQEALKKQEAVKEGRQEEFSDSKTNYEPIEVPVEDTPTQYEQLVTSPVEEPTVPNNIFKTQQRQVVKKPELTIIPEDNELKALFIQAKKHAFAHNPSKAMDMFHRALVRAEQIKDGESQSKICLEMGKIYDDNNYVVQALSSYNKSLKSTTDNNLKTKAHYSMAQIYDEVNQLESALSHYFTSVSYAGECDDLSSQSTSLAKIANIFTDKSNKQAFEFYEEANTLIKQTDDSKTKGYVSSSTASAYSSFNDPTNALRYYASAVKNYSDAKEQDDIAENYKSAAELMLTLNNSAKAKVLLRKALSHTDKSKDAALVEEINNLLAKIA